MFFDRNINGNRDVKFLDCDYLLGQRCVKLTLNMKMSLGTTNIFSLLLPNVYYSLSYCSLKISDVTEKKKLVVHDKIIDVGNWAMKMLLKK